MNTFLLDLWNDLREKRLWPVAAALVLALVAVPVLLAEPAEEPVPPAPAAPAQAERTAPQDKSLRGLAAVKLANEPPGSGSTLSVFDPSDPFKPPARALAAESSQAADSTGAGPSTAGADQGSTSGGGTAGGTTGDTGTGDTGTGDTGDDTGGGTKTIEYRYVVDATFIVNGRKRRIKGMERLDVLPSQANPLLIFLGASSGGGNAVFLVDSTLEATGEGRCKPSEAECAFVYLGAGSEEEFVNEAGDSYTLRVDQIRRIKVTSASAAKSESDARDTGERAGAASGEVPARRFMPPLIADLVSVSSSSDESSDSGRAGR